MQLVAYQAHNAAIKKSVLECDIIGTIVNKVIAHAHIV